jgi:cell shape-determining protein MreC
VNNRKKIPKILSILLILILVFLLFFFRGFFLKSFSFLNLHKFKNENINQTEQIQILQNEIKILKEENKNLQTLNTESSTNTKNLLTIEILGAKSTLYGTFWAEAKTDIQNIASSTNISIGDFVYGENNILVGRIKEIQGKLIKVSLLGSEENFIAETLESKETLEIKASGVGLYVGQISKNSSISTGDLVLIKGKENAIVGNIVDIEENETSLKNIWIRTPYDISKSKIFYVEIK